MRKYSVINKAALISKLVCTERNTERNKNGKFE